jgi:hypothetical protein
LAEHGGGTAETFAEENGSDDERKEREGQGDLEEEETFHYLLPNTPEAKAVWLREIKPTKGARKAHRRSFVRFGII